MGHFHKIALSKLCQYQDYLADQEHSPSTIEKYMRDVQAFYRWLPEEKQIDKQTVMQYKEALAAKGYAAVSVNSMLAALCSFFKFAGWEDCRVKPLRIQRRTMSEGRELQWHEYQKLLAAARQKSERLFLLTQSLCAAGLRVSETRFLTVEAARHGRMTVENKGKRRVVLLPSKLCQGLLRYAQKQKIVQGPLFITRSGKPLDRSNI